MKLSVQIAGANCKFFDSHTNEPKAMSMAVGVATFCPTAYAKISTEVACVRGDKCKPRTREQGRHEASFSRRQNSVGGSTPVTWIDVNGEAVLVVAEKSMWSFVFLRNELRVREIFMGGRMRQGQISVWSNVLVFLTVRMEFPFSSYADFMRSVFILKWRD